MAAKKAKVPVTKAAPAKAAKPPARAVEAHPLLALRREVDQFFHGWPRFGRMLDFDPFKELGMPFGGQRWAMTPVVDVTENEKSYDISVELPGMDEKDIEITLSEDLLGLKGEKRYEREEEKKDFHLTERSYGKFQRTFRLPADVDENKIAASFTKGVLAISLPKTGKAKAGVKKIAVKRK